MIMGDEIYQSMFQFIDFILQGDPLGWKSDGRRLFVDASGGSVVNRSVHE
jgi:hypothetical protein